MAQPALSRLLLDALRSVETETALLLQERGTVDLTPGQARAILLVERTGTRLTDLAATAGVTKQAMMQVLDDLQALGCVRRTPDPADARAKVVKLTAKGLRQRAQARKALAVMEGRLRRRMGPQGYEELRAGLQDLASLPG
jgi:DNA-binding MarR family transcriptional regulator